MLGLNSFKCGKLFRFIVRIWVSSFVSKKERGKIVIREVCENRMCVDVWCRHVMACGLEGGLIFWLSYLLLVLLLYTLVLLLPCTLYTSVILLTDLIPF